MHDTDMGCCCSGNIGVIVPSDSLLVVSLVVVVTSIRRKAIIYALCLKTGTRPLYLFQRAILTTYDKTRETATMTRGRNGHNSSSTFVSKIDPRSSHIYAHSQDDD